MKLITTIYVKLLLLLHIRAAIVTGFSAPMGAKFLVKKLGLHSTFDLIHGGVDQKVHRLTLFSSGAPSADGVTVNGGEGTDTIEAFAQDLATVFHTLRRDKTDPTIPKIFRNEPLPSFSNTWTLADWDRHVSRVRFWDYIRTLPIDRLLFRCSPQLAFFVGWSAFASWACHVGKLKVFLPLTPLSLLSTFVAALISLRSNQGLSRLNEGRKAFGNVVLHTRDMAQLIVSNVYPKDQQLGLKLLRHLSLFGWLSKNFIRGEKVNGNDEDIIRTMLIDPRDADYVLRQRKKPVAVVTRLRQVFYHMSEQGKLNTAEELALDHMSHELNHVLTSIERIRASPIPPLYTAHTGRLLMFYLFFLPVSLSGVLGAFGTVLTTAGLAYTMLGLDEISHLLEQPFKLMPLYHLSKNSMRDVGDALVCQPPSLFLNDDATVMSAEETIPPYW